MSQQIAPLLLPHSLISAVCLAIQDGLRRVRKEGSAGCLHTREPKERLIVQKAEEGGGGVEGGVFLVMENLEACRR